MGVEEEEEGAEVAAVDNKKNIPSLWKANLMAFFAIFVIAFAMALWQTSYLSSSFFQEAKDHARLAAEIIKLNTQNVIEAKKVSSEIVSSFLKSQIKFVRYLHAIEPFTSKELAAFSREAGLKGVSIAEKGCRLVIESEPGWLVPDVCHSICHKKEGLVIFSSKKIFAYSSPSGPFDEFCVVAGIDASKILQVQKRIGLENTLQEISRLSGVSYVKVKMKPSDEANATDGQVQSISDSKEDLDLIQLPSGPVVQVKFDLGKMILLLGMDATSLVKKQKRVWLLLLFFTVILIIFGTIVSLWLYKQQMNYVERIRQYEKRLYQKRHEATLGRSAATIAHEIRNPLNAVSMGIQRLMLQKEVGDKQKEILKMLKGEIDRAGKIISGLLAYAKPTVLEKREVDINSLIRDCLTGVQRRIKADNVKIEMRLLKRVKVMADPDLLFQLFENLFMNAFDALNNAGEILIEVDCIKDKAVIKIMNSGIIPTEEELKRIFEPYFSTKTRGTGLGLAICKKIVKAHDGEIDAKIQNGHFVIEILLPGAEEL